MLFEILNIQNILLHKKLSILGPSETQTKMSLFLPKMTQKPYFPENIQKSCLGRPARSTWIDVTRRIPKSLRWRCLNVRLRPEGVARNRVSHIDLAG